MIARILIVEDEWMIADEIASVIEQAGYNMAGPVPSIAAALDLVRDETITAALLDLKLGDEDSYPIAERLRAEGIPFAFLTGYNEAEVRPDFQTVACLTKPVMRTAIQDAVAKLLQATGEAGS